MAIVTVLVLGSACLYGLASKGGGIAGITSAYRNRFSHDHERTRRSQVRPQPLTGISQAPQNDGGSSTVNDTLGNLLDLMNDNKKEIAMRLVSSAENSSLDWKAQYKYIEDIGDGRGYTAGIIGFCSGTGDMLELVQHYTSVKPDNPLASYIPALKAVNGTASHTGLGDAFVQAWKQAAADPAFQKAQDAERDHVYFDPAVEMAKKDGLRALGQFMYYDAAVMHGPDAWGGGLPDLRDRALKKAKTPAQGGSEATYLQAFLDVRKAEMAKEAAHRDVSRIDGVQQVFLKAGNLDLNTPLKWTVYGDPYTIQ